jgi:hypothetical protein
VTRGTLPDAAAPDRRRLRRAIATANAMPTPSPPSRPFAALHPPLEPVPVPAIALAAVRHVPSAAHSAGYTQSRTDAQVALQLAPAHVYGVQSVS